MSEPENDILARLKQLESLDSVSKIIYRCPLYAASIYGSELFPQKTPTISDYAFYLKAKTDLENSLLSFSALLRNWFDPLFTKLSYELNTYERFEVPDNPNIFSDLIRVLKEKSHYFVVNFDELEPTAKVFIKSFKEIYLESKIFSQIDSKLIEFFEKLQEQDIESTPVPPEIQACFGEYLVKASLEKVKEMFNISVFRVAILLTKISHNLTELHFKSTCKKILGLIKFLKESSIEDFINYSTLAETQFNNSLPPKYLSVDEESGDLIFLEEDYLDDFIEENKINETDKSEILEATRTIRMLLYLSITRLSGLVIVRFSD